MERKQKGLREDTSEHVCEIAGRQRLSRHEQVVTLDHRHQHQMMQIQREDGQQRDHGQERSSNGALLRRAGVVGQGIGHGAHISDEHAGRGQRSHEHPGYGPEERPDHRLAQYDQQQRDRAFRHSRQTRRQNWRYDERNNEGQEQARARRDVGLGVDRQQHQRGADPHEYECDRENAGGKKVLYHGRPRVRASSGR